jgi:hypothetical protein
MVMVMMVVMVVVMVVMMAVLIVVIMVVNGGDDDGDDGGDDGGGSGDDAGDNGDDGGHGDGCRDCSGGHEHIVYDCNSAKYNTRALYTHTLLLRQQCNNTVAQQQHIPCAIKSTSGGDWSVFT